MGALGIMLSKTFGRQWAGDRDLAIKLQHFADGHPIDFHVGLATAKAFTYSRGYTMFAGRFWLLIRIITTLIYLAFILFFSGLVILLFRDSENLGKGILVFNATFGALFGILVLDNLFSTYAPWLLRRPS
jgi:hypothetical protein